MTKDWTAVDNLAVGVATSENAALPSGKSVPAQRSRTTTPSVRQVSDHIDAMPAGPRRAIAKSQFVGEVLKAQKRRLRHILEAQDVYDKGRLEVELKKALALIREDLLTHLATLGHQQLQRRREIAKELEETTKAWLAELETSDMPDFMRRKQIEAVINRWEKMFEDIMGDDGYVSESPGA